MNVPETNTTTFTRFFNIPTNISKVIYVYLDNEHLFSIATYEMTAPTQDRMFGTFYDYRNLSEGLGQGLVGFFENWSLDGMGTCNSSISNGKYYGMDYMFTFFKSSIPESELVETNPSSDLSNIPYTATKFNIIYPTNDVGGTYLNGEIETNDPTFLAGEVAVIANRSIIGLLFPTQCKSVAVKGSSSDHITLTNMFKNKKYTTAIKLLCETFSMENCTSFDTFFYNLNNNQIYKEYYENRTEHIYLSSPPQTTNEILIDKLNVELRNAVNENQRFVLNELIHILTSSVPHDYGMFNRTFGQIMSLIQKSKITPDNYLDFFIKRKLIPEDNRKINGDEPQVNIKRVKNDGDKKIGGRGNTKHKRNTKHSY